MSILVTGATGSIGRRVVQRLADEAPGIPLELLVRDERAARTLAPACGRLTRGDIMQAGLGLARADRARLAGTVTTVVHLAANTSFSQSLDAARAVNRDGTARLLELTAHWPRVSRWVHVSTAFVAGLRAGLVAEDPSTGTVFANAYEQSKAEAEALVRAARRDWVIARPSTVVCGDASGHIEQVNAVHRALRLYLGGLAAMLPGTAASTIDVVTSEYVARGIARAALAAPAATVLQFCAGSGALRLDTLLDLTYDTFLRSPVWRRRGVARPVYADARTYALFESAVLEAGSPRAQQAVRSLSYFVPQLAAPKCFMTTNADALLGAPAAPVASFWTAMVAALVGVAFDRPLTTAAA